MRTLNAAAVWAGLTAFVWYAFGAVPLHMGVSGQLGLSTAQTSSWIFIVWFSGALASIAVSLAYRQPIPITWTIPGLIYLGTLGDRFTFAEIAGANLCAGLLMLGLALAGVGGRIMRWLPLPIIMGMFAGSILEYVTRVVSATVDDVVIAGTAVAGYLLGRMLRNPRVPPVGLAVVTGGAAVAMTGAAAAATIEWALPTLAAAEMRFSPAAIVAVGIPMVVLAMGLGNVQGLGFLLAQEYSVPVNSVSRVVGAAAVVNALFGGHPATVARTGVAILAAPDAGPPGGRYWAVVISSALTILLALAATPVASLLTLLPASYVFALAGLAIVSSLQDALARSFSGPMVFGALVAFVVAVTPFAVLGITSAFWAIVAGVAVSYLIEREQLIQFWSHKP